MSENQRKRARFQMEIFKKLEILGNSWEMRARKSRVCHSSWEMRTVRTYMPRVIHGDIANFIFEYISWISLLVGISFEQISWVASLLFLPKISSHFEFHKLLDRVSQFFSVIFIKQNCDRLFRSLWNTNCDATPTKIDNHHQNNVMTCETSDSFWELPGPEMPRVIPEDIASCIF